MRRFWKIAGWTIAAIVVVIAGLVVRTLNIAGSFTELKPVALANCTAIPGIIGVEDLQIDRAANILFASATDRRAPAGKPNPQDGIYILDLSKTDAKFVKLAGTPANFHPHGLSLYRSQNGSRVLMVVNHPLGGNSRIEIFDVSGSGAAVTLAHRASVSGALLFSPNDVVAVGKDRFYASNDHGSRTALGTTLETYLMLPRSSVVYYDGNVFHEVAKSMTFANGVNVSADLSRIYVAETTGRKISTFDRDVMSGVLTPAGELSIPAGLDNIDVDGEGNLWVAAHPKMLAIQGYRDDPAKPSPSEILKVTVQGGIPVSAVPVYVNAGAQIGAASVGATANGHLFIGSIFDAKVLDCVVK